jgi:hypothetical protein
MEYHDRKRSYQSQAPLVDDIKDKKYRMLTHASFRRLLNWLNGENEDNDSGGS